MEILPVFYEAKTAFDPSYYFEKYVDAANEYGFDTQSLFNHYQTVGMQEGRFPNRESEWKAAAGYADFLLNEKIPARN